MTNAIKGSLSLRFPNTVTKETLKGTSIRLTNFFFRYGANIYVFTYEKNGETKHTFIDTGYLDHGKYIFPILEKHDVFPKHIENIIITHRHPDHSGLAVALAKASGATIFVHINFKDFIQGNISERERRWFGKFDPTRLRKYRLEYLFGESSDGFIQIGGLDFPISNRKIELGKQGYLSIITVPKSSFSHSPDQIAVLYSPRKIPYVNDHMPENNGFKPTDEIIFAGDLWLMRGPIFERSLRGFPMTLKFLFFKIKDALSGQKVSYPSPSEQDVEAKKALKEGFSVIRVKPGHGDEFLGSQIIPRSLLAKRDLLMKLGYSIEADKSLILLPINAPKVRALRKKAYTDFIESLCLFLDMGYSPEEISQLLIRIYSEQTGGGPLVEEDRKERKQLLKKTIERLIAEKKAPDALYQIVSITREKMI